MVEKITDNSDENTFHQLTSQSAALVMPLFQRHYVWTQKQLSRMVDEIESVLEDESKSRFLGAIISVRRLTNPSQPDVYEIVDGQQRMTTLYLIMLASAQIAAAQGKMDFAKGLLGTNLFVDWARDVPFNTKLVPSIGDRAQFREIYRQVMNSGDLEEWLSSRLRLPHGGTEETGPLIRQYNNIRKYLHKKIKTHGFEYLERFVDASKNGLTFVFILLKDPGSATTVFQGLNDPGVPISVGDLVKNEVFARTGYDAKNAKELHDRKWVPFYNMFGDKFNDFFFPYSIILKNNTSKTDMFRNLRQEWEGKGSEDIIDNLQLYARPFLSLAGREGECEPYPKKLANQLTNLTRLRQPAAAYPFGMRLLNHYDQQEISLSEVVKIFCVLESFFVRRALCGVEPTGLLGMFRTMWSNMEGRPSASKVASVILRRQTVEWPTDTRIKEQIRARPLYGSSIARFVVFELDRAQRADQGSYESFTIEHVLPQNLNNNWSKDFDRQTHSRMKDLWANLLPLTSEMNNQLKQSEYTAKKKVFELDSMFASTRRFGAEYDQWTPIELANRSEEMFNFATSRWPRLVE